MSDEPVPPGLAKMNEVYGWDSPDYPGDFFAITRDHLFGEIWARPNLDTKQRRLMLIGLMAGRGLNDVLEIQLDAAYRLGDHEIAADHLVHCISQRPNNPDLKTQLDASKRELDAGWPTTAGLNGIVEKVIAKYP